VPREWKRGARTIAVALHEIEPATFERCAEIRKWLGDRGVDRVTLLVIPARDLHPLGERSPEMVDWLIERRHRGDSIAQHGFQYSRLRRPQWPQRVLAPVRGARSGRAAEFVGLDGPETRRAVEAGWRLLKLAGVEPDGFVAPAYAYTPALRRVLQTRFRWWAGLLSLHGATAFEEPTRAYLERESLGEPTDTCSAREPLGGSAPAGGARRWRRLAPVWSPGAEGPLGRVFSPGLIRAGATLTGGALRLDLRPGVLEHPRHTLALERALEHAAQGRDAVTYDQLAAGQAARRSGGAAALSVGLAAKL
jgi:predicted deacetylase